MKFLVVTPLSIYQTVLLDPLWLLPREYKVVVNKSDDIDAAFWDAEPSNARISLDDSVATEKVWASVAVYIP